nr:trigger factor [Gammaproteobacteria bacterium]
MQVQVEQTGALGRRMKIEVPAEQIDGEVEQRLRSLAGRVKLHGFRPGKVPLKVVRNRYGKEVRAEVVGEVMRKRFYEALAEQELKPVGGPELEAETDEPGKDLEYIATFEVYPDVEVKGLDTLEVERPQVELTDADVDKVLERMRAQRTSYETVERPAAQGDRVTLDFEGRIDGAEFPGNRGEGVQVVLGEGRFLADLERGLEGAGPGEARTIPVQFPEDYPREEVAGKRAEFSVQVREIAEPRVPEIDGAFARAFGIEDGSVERLREEARASMQREVDRTVRDRIKRQVLDHLVEANQDLEIPAALVDQEVERLRGQLGQQMQGSDPAQLPADLFERQARRRVILGLVLGELVKEQGIKPDPAKVRRTIEGIAADYDKPDEVVQWYHQNPTLREGVEGMVVEDQVVTWLIDQA